MNFKRVLSSIVASSVFVTCMTNSLTTYAEEPATLAELMSDIVGIALTDIQSSSKDTAVATALSKVSISDSTVSFDGTQIGYWFEDTPTMLYSDVDKTTQLAHKTADGYELDSNLAYKLLSEVNSHIVENYVPTTSDWSKIIGKYDVQLGDIKIKADNWIPLTPVDSVNDFCMDNSNYFNMKDACGSLYTWNKDAGSTNLPVYGVYMIDNAGKLYVSNAQVAPRVNGYNFYMWSQVAGSTSNSTEKCVGTGSGYRTSDIEYLTYKLGLTKTAKGINPVLAFCNLSSIVCSAGYNDSAPDSYYKMLPVNIDPVPYAGDYTDIKQYGIFHYNAKVDLKNSSWWDYPSSKTGSLAYAMTSMFKSQSCSKTVNGNTVLTRRLSKISNLLPTDTLEVKSTGWTINGTDNIDTYVGSQTMIEAGDTAEISSLVDADALTFDVVVPTVLPVSIDDHGVVTVASNASIKNQSGLPVKITGVSIRDKPASGWTLVQTQPSTAQGATEFNFTTSIVEGTVLDCDETLTFAYDAKLSPVMTGLENLDIASVLLTVDWAQ